MRSAFRRPMWFCGSFVWASILAAIVVGGWGQRDQAAGLTWIGTGAALDVSSDGRYVVGTNSSNSAFRWDSSGGTQLLGFTGIGFSVSADGSVVVGWQNSPTLQQGVRWTAQTGAVVLMASDGTAVRTARKVSADGSVVVGALNAPSSSSGYRWTAADQAIPLGGPASGGSYGIADAITSDGTYIVTNHNGNTPLYRLGGPSGPVALGTLPGNTAASGFAYDISDDGAVIVGEASNGAHSVPFRWTSTTGMQEIPLLTSGVSGRAWSVSDGGSVIVGATDGANGAFIWDASDGTRYLGDVLSGLGVDMTGVALYDAYGVSADGTVIVGDGSNGAFVAVVPEPSLAAGAMLLLALPALQRRRRR